MLNRRTGVNLDDMTSVLDAILWLYIWLIIIRVVLSWVGAVDISPVITVSAIWIIRNPIASAR